MLTEVRRSAQLLRLAIATASVAVAVASPSRGLPLFLELPLPARRAHGVSADGGTVVGQAGGLGNPAFRWTEAEGVVLLGDLPGGPTFAVASAASADGSVIVGHGTPSSGWNEPFRWTDATGMVGLGYLPPGGSVPIGIATAVSGDGSVVVGWSASTDGSSTTQVEAFRWTPLDGMVGLGDFPGGFFGSHAYGISSDGSTVVGAGTHESGGEAFRWTHAGGMIGLGDLAGGPFGSTAYAISGDGSAMVGASQSTSGIEAFRWTEAGGMVGLGSLFDPVFFNSWAYATSADGSVVVGTSVGEAFIWDAEHGMRPLRDVLIERGLDPGLLGIATGISADGNVIAGTSGDRVWVVNLLPEPSTWLLLSLGGAGVARWRRHLVQRGSGAK